MNGTADKTVINEVWGLIHYLKKTKPIKHISQTNLSFTNFDVNNESTFLILPRVVVLYPPSSVSLISHFTLYITKQHYRGGERETEDAR